MKKQMVLALGLAVISGSALASKARLEALGENGNGSQYLMDSRNIFLNPAQANYFKDMVTFETGDTTNEGDTASAPNAEGGFLRASGNMVYGVFFGHEDTAVQNIRVNAGGTSASFEDQNTWDLFVAGDAGVQWGANLSYSSFENDQVANAIKSDVMRVNLGVISGDTEVFLRASLVDTAEEDNTVDLEVKSRYDLGVSHNISGGTLFARYTSLEAEQSEGTTEDWKSTAMTVGWGKVRKLNDTSAFNYSVAYGTTDVEGASFAANSDSKSTTLAVTMGLETMVKEWLTLRAGISQNIMNEEENDGGKKTTGADSTSVTAGASLVFGDFQIDGMIGNNSDGSANSGNDTSAGNGTLRTDSLLSRVSATYRF